MENKILIPEKVYIYVDTDDTICECTLRKQELDLHLSDKVAYRVIYSSPSFTIEFIIDDENWEKEYEEEGFCVFRNYDDVVREREYIVTKNYSLYLNRLHSPPNFES
jgi:hypothetical protein